MQNKTLKDLLNEEADRLLEEISELLRIIEPFAKGDYVSFGIRKDLTSAAKPIHMAYISAEISSAQIFL